MCVCVTRDLAILQSVDLEAEQAEAAAQELQQRVAAMSSGSSSSSYATTTWSDSEDDTNSGHSSAWQGKQVCVCACVDA